MAKQIKQKGFETAYKLIVASGSQRENKRSGEGEISKLVEI